MNNQKLLLDTIWTASGHLISLFIVLGTNIILARVLTPSIFGQYAIIIFFVSILNVISEGGLGGALVRNEKRTELDYSTVFTFNIVVSLFTFILIFFSSTAIAFYFQIPEIKLPLIVSSTILIISSFQITQNLRLMSELRFKEKTIINLISSSIASCIGIVLGYYFEWEIYALVSITVLTSLIQTVLYINKVGLFLDFRFSKVAFRSMFNFGINTTFVSILNLAFDNIYNLILGKFFSIQQTGYFYQAKKIQDVPNNIINNLTQGVFFSNLSKIQQDHEKVLNSYYLLSKTFLWLSGFVVLTVVLFGDKIIYMFLGEKWIGSIFFFKVLIVGSFFYTQELINKMIFKVYNKTGTLLKLELIKKLAQSVTILIGILLDRIDVLLYGYILTNAFSYFINYLYTSKIIKIGKKELIFLLKITLILSFLLVGNYFFSRHLGQTWQIFLSIFYLFLYILFSIFLDLLNIKRISKLLLNKAS